jgi:hypothetical protein
MRSRLGEGVRTGCGVTVAGTLALYGSALILAGHADPHLYAALLGPTMANPAWRPGPAFWLVAGGSLGLAATVGALVGWLRFRRAG